MAQDPPSLDTTPVFSQPVVTGNTQIKILGKNSTNASIFSFNNDGTITNAINAIG
jgi:hypothetical protein